MTKAHCGKRWTILIKFLLRKINFKLKNNLKYVTSCI